jgi:hypothetical protein
MCDGDDEDLVSRFIVSVDDLERKPPKQRATRVSTPEWPSLGCRRHHLDDPQHLGHELLGSHGISLDVPEASLLELRLGGDMKADSHRA